MTQFLIFYSNDYINSNFKVFAISVLPYSLFLQLAYRNIFNLTCSTMFTTNNILLNGRDLKIPF